MASTRSMVLAGAAALAAVGGWLLLRRRSSALAGLDGVRADQLTMAALLTSTCDSRLDEQHGARLQAMPCPEYVHRLGTCMARVWELGREGWTEAVFPEATPYDLRRIREALDAFVADHEWTDPSTKKLGVLAGMGGCPASRQRGR